MPHGSDRLSCIAESISADGYHLEEAVIRDHSLLDALCSNLSTAYSKQVGREQEFYPGTVHFVPRHHSVFWDLLLAEEVTEVVDYVYGLDHILHSYNGLVLEPGLQMIQHRPHRDGPHTASQGPPAAFQVLVFLDDCIESTGATRVLPGSHRSPVASVDVERFNREAVTVEGSKGSALFFDSALFHAAGDNRSDEPCHRLTMSYVRPNMSQQFDFESLITFEEQKKLNYALKSLLRIGQRTAKSIEEFYERAEKIYK